MNCSRCGAAAKAALAEPAIFPRSLWKTGQTVVPVLMSFIRSRLHRPSFVKYSNIANFNLMIVDPLRAS
jgi:hypothetical protein